MDHMHKINHLLHQHPQKMKKVVKGKRSIKRGRTSEDQQRKGEVKVVYISTPMKVKISASKFRDIVQELTGQESDVVRIMETSGGRDTWNMVVPPDHHHNHDHDHQEEDGFWAGPRAGLLGPGPGPADSGSSPTSSTEEMTNSNNKEFDVHQDGGFCTQFDANLFYDQFCQQLDVLGTY